MGVREIRRISWGSVCVLSAHRASKTFSYPNITSSSPSYPPPVSFLLLRQRLWSQFEYRRHSSLVQRVVAFRDLVEKVRPMPRDGPGGPLLPYLVPLSGPD